MATVTKGVTKQGASKKKQPTENVSKISKYGLINAIVVEMFKKGGFTQKQIADKACSFLNDNGIEHSYEAVLETIGKATRPLDHKKNIWGVNACYSRVDGTFSCANYKGKYGVTSHTIESFTKANDGVDKYAELTKKHKANTKDFSYASKEYGDIIKAREAEKKAARKKILAKAKADLAEAEKEANGKPTAKPSNKKPVGKVDKFVNQAVQGL